MKKSSQPKIIFPPNKELGQNFLFDRNYLQKIVESCPIAKETIVIEIGSGYGNLTNMLAETNCQRVISLEKDQNLFQQLVANNQNKKITYFCQDALQINWEKFCSEYQNGSLILVGNLPYYITNSLLINLLFNYRLFTSLIFLVQKEVGQKWASSPVKYSSKYSALSVFINYLAEVKIVFEVPHQVFIPSPSVDGALVIINPKPNVDIQKEYLSSFLSFLKNCFHSRRKTLLNNLSSFAGNQERGWNSYFLVKNFSSKIRPQNLTPAEYFDLFLFWQKNNHSLGKSVFKKNTAKT